MSKEKLKEMGELQEIIDKGDWDVHDSEDVKWLINYAKGQSERVQELEEKLKNYTAYIEQLEEDDTRMMRDIRWLGKQNKRYREALGRISEHEIYGIDIRCGEELSTDAGKIARKALEGEE